MKPLVNEHFAQQRNPDAYETHYRQEAVDGIAFVFGTTDGESEVISVRADRNKWTPQSFKIWLERNGYASEVVAATDNPNAINTEPTPEPAPEPAGVTLPEFILQAIALGVKLYEQGNGGSELHPRAVKEARKALESGQWSAGKIRRADAFLSRKGVDLEPGPLAARLCWGDDPREEQRGADWIKEIAAELSGAPDVNTTRHDSPMFYHEANQSQIDDFLIFERKAVEGWPEGVIGLYAVNDDNNEQNLVSILGHSSEWTVESFSRWLDGEGYRSSVEPAECEVISSRQSDPVDLAVGDNCELPSYVVSALRKGLKLHDAGLSGDGLQPATVRAARAGAVSGEWSHEKVVKSSAWFARHEADRESMTNPGEWNKPPNYSPAYVAWLLWGSDADNKGRDWIDKKAGEIRRGEIRDYSYKDDKKKTYYSDPSTPAPKKDQIKGSDKNEPGSASSDGGGIVVSDSVRAALENKTREHNEKYSAPSKRAKLSALLKVYRRGAGAFSTSHRPNVSRAAWAMARVNAFLYLLKNGKPKNAAYVGDNDLLPIEHPRSSKGEDSRQSSQGKKNDRPAGDLARALDTFGGHIELNIDAPGSAPLHVMRPGPLYDIEGGKVFDLSPEDLHHIAGTTQALIDAGHVVPISFEHGIERGERPGSDRRPYGMATRVFFDEATGGIYAEKSWTKVGLKLVTDSLMADGTTALRVSPRLQMTEAHHPTTGEQLGQAYIDTVSITTTPRQDSMEAVVMSRDTTDQTEEPATVSAVNQPPGPDAGLDTEDQDMSDERLTLLARGSDEASALFSACGLNEDDGIELLIEKIGNLAVSLDAAGVELARYKKEEDDRAAALLEQETDVELSRFEFATDGERAFFRAALLSGDENQINLAREALNSRTTPNPDELITTAIASAKARGAVAADFILSDEMMETARTSPAIVTALLEAIPTGNIVDTTAAAPGSDAAGVEVVADVNREEAANELSRIAHNARREGRATTFTEAYELARAERPELALAVYGD